MQLLWVFKTNKQTQKNRQEIRHTVENVKLFDDTATEMKLLFICGSTLVFSFADMGGFTRGILLLSLLSFVKGAYSVQLADAFSLFLFITKQ